MFVMYQSISSLTIPRANPGDFFERANSPPPWAQRKCETPTPVAEKSCQEPHPGATIFKNLAKNTKHEIEIMKNSTEILIYLEILKQ